jgi:hypothetical protein
VEAASAPAVPASEDEALAEPKRDDSKEPPQPAGKSDDEHFEDFVQRVPAPLARALKSSKARFDADAKGEMKRVAARMLALAPYAVLCSLPFYAGLLALVYGGRRMAYGAHFVFAMHLHAAWYGVLLIGQLPTWLPTTFALFWANLYPLLALKRVYGGGWWGTVLRGTLLASLHFVLLLLGLLLLGLVGALG